MPLYDFQCRNCGFIFEAFAKYEEHARPCPECRHPFATRVISCGSSFLRPDAVWLESVKTVVDKESTKPETRAFLETPTRENWRRWMKAEGIRPLEEGEKPAKLDERWFVSELAEKVMKRKKERERIEL